ncbi:hypothetical protein PHAVU_007G092400 [Phaseolus vulgaris]|uniref:Uncharacterized protein n=1 Tax=Phaseolus vulgaris TaxID=3885 RepID=V7BCV5_PHAVU|nr:hypothetical protein PHAVU_007G092400g [Phaseolus vulgaris]ESW15672.1 hypothetical protein PHAVU_007G092400g [Phaseolus vulgaris]
MAVKEFHSDQEVGNEESNLLQVDPYEEEEETLSLCDLPIYSGYMSDTWGGEDGKRFGDDGDDGDDDNLFEFFSEEFTSSSNSAAAENIIFCGKLIPFKDIPPRVDECNSTARRNVQKGIAKRGSNGSKSFACDYTSDGKVSLVRCTTKSRWFLFMFGMSKLSSTTEMELKDIRNRQSRRGPAAMFPAAEEDAVKGKKRGCKGMWKILKSITMVLGCRSSKLANDVVKAALV